VAAIVLTDCYPDFPSYRRALRTGRGVHANILYGLGQHSSLLSLRAGNISYSFGLLGVDSLPGVATLRRHARVILVPFYRRWASDVAGLGAIIDSLRDATNADITLIDIADQPSSPYLSLLPRIDRLLKGQLCADRSLYHGSDCMGAPFQRWCQTLCGWTSGEHEFQSPAAPGQVSKLQLGWTFGTVPFFSRLAIVARCLARPLGRRKTHLHARFSATPVGPADSMDYYTRYRSLSATKVRELPSSIKATEPRLVNRWQFYRELFDSQIVFSPFGWGEVCFRDYEAAAAGCVLLKPDMSHLETRPSIYQENVTYVPVRWDLSDLHDKVDWILSRPSDAAAIAGNLKRTYFQSLRNPGFPL
jgi:hypothetical protein